ncbi:unnamed protein product [Calypogeia fissa]
MVVIPAVICREWCRGVHPQKKQQQQLQQCKQNDAGREGLQRLAERRGRPGLQWNRAMRASKARQQQGRERQRSRRAGTGTGHTDGQRTGLQG